MSLAKLPFISTITIIIILAIATFIEKANGSDYVYSQIYGSWWFAALWGLLVAVSLLGIIKGKLYKNRPLLLLHISFIVILAGALCTKLTAKQGYIILNKGIENTLVKTDNDSILLDFSVKLDTFYISYYPGTSSPADYISQISIKDNDTQESVAGIVSMNNIFSHDGYRFYQTSFEDDLQTSILSVNKDIWGISLTYSGYTLFAVAMLWLLFSRDNAFRKLLSNPLLKKIGIIFLFIAPLSSSAQTITPDSLTVEREQADRFSELWMLYDGRITPVATFAHDFTLKLTGKSKFGYLNSNQFLMAFLFFPQKWEQVALFEVHSPELKKLLNAETEKAALQDFFDKEHNYKLADYLNNDIITGAKKTEVQKEVEKLNEKIQLINMLHSGGLLQLYPQLVKNRLEWFYPTQNLRTPEEQAGIQIIRNSLFDYYKAISANDNNAANNVIKEISTFQQKNGGEFLPSQMHKDAEIFYLKVDFTSILFMLNLTLGCLSLLTVFILPESKLKVLHKIFYFSLLFSFLVHTFSLGLRTYIGGRLPFSNGFETMMLVAWCAMGIALIFSSKIKIVVTFGFLISGCCLLVAHLGMMNPKITPLVPVLSSPLLSIHVSIIMLAYTLLAFVALNSLISIISVLIVRKKDTSKVFQQLERNKIYSEICLYPSLFFLGGGIFIGAVWANISWGRYWGWDPKEVWALITFLLYSLILHQKNIKCLSHPLSFHIFGLLAFLSVLMTYFGVNYFLGGMHSYAGSIEFDKVWIWTIIVFIIIFTLIISSYLRYKSLEKELYKQGHH